MGKVIWHTPMSLDGFMAGPDDDMGWVFDVDGGSGQTADEVVQSTGAPAAVNAVRGGAAQLMAMVADGGRLVTTTSDGPPPERGVTVTNFYVSADGELLEKLATDFVARHLTIPLARHDRLPDAAAALAAIVSGHAGGGVVLVPDS